MTIFFKFDNILKKTVKITDNNMYYKSYDLLFFKLTFTRFNWNEGATLTKQNNVIYSGHCKHYDKLLL